jgi:predicted acetyltransferase
MTMQLIKPSLDTLPGFADALERGWSPDNVRGAAAAREHLDAIKRDPAAFVARLDDVEAKGAPVTLPDGSTVPRLPGFHRWMWDGGFCGNIGFRWQSGTSALPSYVLGDIGYAVVPWKRGRGYASRALALTLPAARDYGLTYVELITDPDNIPSQRVIEACGGKLVERFREHEAYGGKESLRYRIDLQKPR